MRMGSYLYIVAVGGNSKDAYFANKSNKGQKENIPFYHYMGEIGKIKQIKCWNKATGKDEEVNIYLDTSDFLHSLAERKRNKNEI